MRKTRFARISVMSDVQDRWALVDTDPPRVSCGIPQFRVLAGKNIKELPTVESWTSSMDGHRVRFTQTTMTAMRVEPVEPDELPCFLDSPIITDDLARAIRGDLP